MNWQFTNQNILRETASGYEIHLIDGTWFHPKRLKPVATQSIDHLNQRSLLRSGLNHIRTIGRERNKDIERSITSSLLAS